MMSELGDQTFRNYEISLTLLFRLRQGMYAEDTAFRLPDLPSEASGSSDVPGSSLGRSGRGGIT